LIKFPLKLYKYTKSIDNIPFIPYPVERYLRRRDMKDIKYGIRTKMIFCVLLACGFSAGFGGGTGDSGKTQGKASNPKAAMLMRGPINDNG
jgi:hypothetical protein